MPSQTLLLPKGWTEVVRSGVLHAISLACTALTVIDRTLAALLRMALPKVATDYGHGSRGVSCRATWPARTSSRELAAADQSTLRCPYAVVAPAHVPGCAGIAQFTCAQRASPGPISSCHGSKPSSSGLTIPDARAVGSAASAASSRARKAAHGGSPARATQAVLDHREFLV